MNILILWLWAFLNLIVGTCVICVNLSYCENKNINLIWYSLIYQYMLYDWAKEKLNIIGIIILEIFITLVTLPLTVVVIIIGCIQYLWKIFCKVFTKRST